MAKLQIVPEIDKLWDAFKRHSSGSNPSEYGQNFQLCSSVLGLIVDVRHPERGLTARRGPGLNQEISLLGVRSRTLCRQKRD